MTVQESYNAVLALQIKRQNGYTQPCLTIDDLSQNISKEQFKSHGQYYKFKIVYGKKQMCIVLLGEKGTKKKS